MGKSKNETDEKADIAIRDDIRDDEHGAAPAALGPAGDASPREALDESGPTKPALPPRGRQSTSPKSPDRPICQYHQVPMEAGRSEAFFTRYYCPVEGCNNMRKQPRPEAAAQMREKQFGDEDFSAR